LPEDIRYEVGSLTTSRKVGIDEPVYRQGDGSNELYQLLKYENLLGQEQLTPSYTGKPVDKI
jgi:hypothetical protein